MSEKSTKQDQLIKNVNSEKEHPNSDDEDVISLKKNTLRSKMDSLAYKYHHDDSEDGLGLE